MALNKNLPIQLHYQLANELRSYIKAGKWKLGELFPTDREIMERYGVSGTTVRRAIKQLVKEDWIERIPGKGTFIKREPLKEELGNLTGFFEEVRSRGMKPHAKLLSAGLMQLESSLLEAFPELQDWPDQEIVVFRKVHLIEDEPIAFVTSFWKKEYGQQLLAHDLEHTGLYEIAQQQFGLQLTEADQDIYAGTPKKEEQEQLQLPDGAPVLLMDRKAYANDLIVEFSHTVYRADRYSYHVVLHHNKPLGQMVLRK